MLSDGLRVQLTLGKTVYPDLNTEEQQQQQKKLTNLHLRCFLQSTYFIYLFIYFGVVKAAHMHKDTPASIWWTAVSSNKCSVNIAQMPGIFIFLTIFYVNQENARVISNMNEHHTLLRNNEKITECLIKFCIFTHWFHYDIFYMTKELNFWIQLTSPALRRHQVNSIILAKAKLLKRH